MKAMKQYDLSGFIDKTVLLPLIIGERVAAQGGLTDARESFAFYVQGRILQLYNCNPRIRKQMNSIKGLEYLYMYARHWLPAWIEGGASGQVRP